MKQAKRLFALVALALAVVATSGCSKEEEQTEGNNQVVTSTTTISLNNGTKQLTELGEKSFAAGELIAVVYENTSGTLQKIVDTLAEGDILPSGKAANITVSMTNPKRNGKMKIIYPASMATDDGDVNYAALATQDGTLASLSGTLDLSIYEGKLDGTALPTGPYLHNPLTVCEFKVKDEDYPVDLTPFLSMFYITDGTNSYYVGNLAGTSMGKTSIWVAMKPVTVSNTLTFRAIPVRSGGTSRYEKTITGKTLAAGNMYHVNVGVKILPLGTLFGVFSISDNEKVRFSQGNLQAYYESIFHRPTLSYTETLTWEFADNQYDYIGNAGGNINLSSHSSPYINGNGKVDLFGWVGATSTAGVNPYGIDSSDRPSEYTSYTTAAVRDETLKNDWADVRIKNGGNTERAGWLTMTSDQWDYLLSPNARMSSAVGGVENGIGAKARVGTTNGLILFPDNYVHPADVHDPVNVNSFDVEYANDNYTLAEWKKMEAAGAVFLPAAGARVRNVVTDAGEIGRYWSKTPKLYTSTHSSVRDEVGAYSLQFTRNGCSGGGSSMSVGNSVRLVRPVE